MSFRCIPEESVKDSVDSAKPESVLETWNERDNPEDSRPLDSLASMNIISFDKPHHPMHGDSVTREIKVANYVDLKNYILGGESLPEEIMSDRESESDLYSDFGSDSESVSESENESIPVLEFIPNTKGRLIEGMLEFVTRH
ncbi:hypothetical protein TNCV_461951 [Trichonephila clavipes]|uniref:Uncharacterized protein n=1 Tax=Trichonephila clavipes TaxID=2585209 RepID=A0A8X6R2Z4_TRICX|nr:hypothetical protein TNCV_461951 [Trichonephila clavipes]